MNVMELAQLAGGEVDGDGKIEIKGFRGIDSAKPGDITFAVDEKRLELAEKSGASCILTDSRVRKSTKTLIRVKNPKFSFLIIYNKLKPAERRPAFIHPTVSVSKSARLGKEVWIGSYVTIEDGVDIGDNTIIESNCVIKKNCKTGMQCRIFPNVTLYENTIIGNNVILHSGVVIGADGFGYVKEKGTIYKFPQLGNVIIKDNVEIGSNTTIDRGSLGNTVIGENSKIDNLCQIAHNVQIGKNVIIAAAAAIGGSVIIKDDVTMGGEVGIADNVTVGKNVIVGGRSGITYDIEDGSTIWGTPARPATQVKRELVVLSWITKNIKQFKKLIK
jgi:UDP-3-O-[3-hydroxymyristoyl] glucosamine N-acyltransferase